MAKKGKRKSKSKSTQSLLNNKILINIIMDKVNTKKSRAKKRKAKKSVPKAEQSPAPGQRFAQSHVPDQMQNQLAYMNNLTLMNRVQPRMFLHSNLQDRIDYKTQESIENGDIRERIRAIHDAQMLQGQQMLQGMSMNQDYMRAITQNNTIAPTGSSAHPVQNHLQEPYSGPVVEQVVEPVVQQQEVGVGGAGSEGEEEINGDAAAGNVTQAAIGMGQETDDLREFYKGTGLTIEPKSGNKLAGLKMTGIYTIMTNSLEPDQIKWLEEKYSMGRQMKKFSAGGTINDFAKDFFRLKDMQ